MPTRQKIIKIESVTYIIVNNYDKKRVSIVLFCLMYVVLLLMPCRVFAKEWKLWYRYPAREWEEALPVGNGRLGGMIFGGIDRERNSRNYILPENMKKQKKLKPRMSKYPRISKSARNLLMGQVDLATYTYVLKPL